MKSPVEVTEASFETEVLKSDRPVLVAFDTGWSPPSTPWDEVVEGIAAETLDSIKVVRVTLDRSPRLGLWCGIRCIPTFLCFIDGEQRLGIFGTRDKDAIIAQLRPVISLHRLSLPRLIGT